MGADASETAQVMALVGTSSRMVKLAKNGSKLHNIEQPDWAA
jgi:hypothetical protein